MGSRRWLVLAVLPALLNAQERKKVDYHKADLIRTSIAGAVATSVRPSYLEDSVRFWFKSSAWKDRGTYYLVDPRDASRKVFFDHARMAASLSTAADTTLDPARFPTFKVVNKDATLEIKTHKNTFNCEIATYKCAAADTLAIQRRDQTERGPDYAVRSPDKKWDVFTWNENIYVRPSSASDADLVAKQDSIKREIERKKQDSIRKSRGEKVDPAPAPPKPANPDSTPLPSGAIQLTTDGEYLNTYSVQMWQPVKRDKKIAPRRATVSWAPDSKRIAILRTNVKNTRIYPMYSSTKDQPEDRSYYFSAPGDTVIQMEEIHILDVNNRSNIIVKESQMPVVVHGMSGLNEIVRWGRTSDKMFTLNATRGSHRVRANMIDANTGAILTQVARDSNDTFVEQAPGGSSDWSVVNNGDDILWHSTRDGWDHLYRFDNKGTLKNQIESGAYAVQNMVRIDSVKKQIYFQAWGKVPGVPYYAHIFRVNFDGSGMTSLTPEDAHHAVSFTPHGDYMIDSYSRRDMPPITVLRSASDGRVVMELSRADVSQLTAIGWTPGEVFTAKARDGVTDIYGVMYKPSDFDPSKSYPIISNIYPGPFIGSVGSWGFEGSGETRAIAELGFIVVQIDHMGTSKRSKSFHDNYYGNMGDNGIPDHIAAIRQLAARYPWVDVNRVGMYGASGGGLATADALFRWPDFFKVGVADAGNHNPATYGFFWAEKYEGLYDKTKYTRDANYSIANQLKGHLLLMAGDLDSNVHPAATLKVVDALIKANKANFDLLLVPDGGHGAGTYGTRRRWDYFVRYLMDADPPEDYQMMEIDYRSMM